MQNQSEKRARSHARATLGKLAADVRVLTEEVAFLSRVARQFRNVSIMAHIEAERANDDVQAKSQMPS